MTASGDEYLHQADYAALTPSELMGLRRLMTADASRAAEANSTTHAAIIQRAAPRHARNDSAKPPHRLVTRSSESGGVKPCGHVAW